MEILAAVIATIFFLGVYWVLLTREQKRADEEKKQWHDWCNAVIDVLTSIESQSQSQSRESEPAPEPEPEQRVRASPRARARAESQSQPRS